MNIFDRLLSGYTGISAMFLLLNAYIFYHNRQTRYLGYLLAGVGMVIYIPCNILLYHIATNVCLNVIRNQASRRTDANEEALARIACADEQETRTLAGVILDRLFRHEPPSTRTMAVLHFVDGLTLGEVAEACGLSVSGVRKRLREFRRRAGLAQEE